jgi:hypothetical protein
MNIFEQAITQLKQRQQLLAILVFSLVSIMVWIGVGLITSQHSSAISPDLRQKAEPLTPNINTQIIQRIEAEEYMLEEELQDFPVFRVVDPDERAVEEEEAEESENTGDEPSPSPVSEASNSAELDTPAATSSANETL